MKSTKIVTAIAALFFFVYPPIHATQTNNTKQDFISEAKKQGAADGSPLTKSPKIKPDKKTYYLQGQIHQADDNPHFLARLSHPIHAELASFMMTGHMMPESTNYFAVILPEHLQEAYFENAKINGRFDLIGKYIDNMEYETISGEDKKAPVFMATYLKLLGTSENDSSSDKQELTKHHQEPEKSTFEACIDSSGGNFPAMISCSQHELEQQDKRLNANYKQALTAAQDKKSLRNVQRQWIKYRDAKCSIEPDSGQAGMLNHVECLRKSTHQRADELEVLGKAI